ncbi:hypothetical protein FRB90_009417, partial [Tulasnella sp. 427]
MTASSDNPLALKRHYDSLPPETWLYIVRYVSPKDHHALLVVSSFFRSLAEQFIYERISAKLSGLRSNEKRWLECLRSIRNRPEAAKAVRWLDISVDPSTAFPKDKFWPLIRGVLANVEKLHVLRLYGLGNIVPKDLKKGCLQYLKAYRGSPENLKGRGTFPAVVEVGYFNEQALDRGGWREHPANRYGEEYWAEVLNELPSTFPGLRTFTMGSVRGIEEYLTLTFEKILPSLQLERLDVVNFTPLSIPDELTLVRKFHSLCPTLRNIRLSSYNGDWRYLSDYD